MQEQTTETRNSAGTLILDFDGTLTRYAIPLKNISKEDLNKPDEFRELLLLAQKKHWNVFIVSNNKNIDIIQQGLKLAFGDDYHKLIHGINYGDGKSESKVERIQQLATTGTLLKNFTQLQENINLPASDQIVYIDDQEENNPFASSITFIQSNSINTKFIDEACKLINGDLNYKKDAKLQLGFELKKLNINKDNKLWHKSKQSMFNIKQPESKNDLTLELKYK